MSINFDQDPTQTEQGNLPFDQGAGFPELSDQELTESLFQNVDAELGEISELESRDIDPALDDLSKLMADTQSTHSPKPPKSQSK
jgi:hypothetical protein